MSNPTVSLRISNYHLARGLRAIRLLEPNWQLTTTSDLIRTIFNDYIAKSENLNKTPLNVPPELLQEIVYARAGMTKNPLQNDSLNILPTLGQNKQQPQRSAQQIQEELEQEKYLQQLKQESREKQAQQDATIDKQIELAHQTSKRTFPKPSEFHDPNITESVISSVTDFSPPEEWKNKQDQ